MSYCFGVTYEKPSRMEAQRRQQIATEHGSEFVEINVVEKQTPSVNNGRYLGTGKTCLGLMSHTSLFRGDPFNGRLAAAVLNAIVGDRS